MQYIFAAIATSEVQTLGMIIQTVLILCFTVVMTYSLHLYIFRWRLAQIPLPKGGLESRPWLMLFSAFALSILVLWWNLYVVQPCATFSYIIFNDSGWGTSLVAHSIEGLPNCPFSSLQPRYGWWLSAMLVFALHATIQVSWLFIFIFNFRSCQY